MNVTEFERFNGPVNCLNFIKASFLISLTFWPIVKVPRNSEHPWNANTSQEMTHNRLPKKNEHVLPDMNSVREMTFRIF